MTEPLLLASARVNPEKLLDSGFQFSYLVEFDDLLEHVNRGVARVKLMFLVVDRRVPERHDRIAHVFVDRPFAGEDGVG